MPILARIYVELLPWEPIFLIAIAMVVLILVSFLIRAMRRGPRRAATLRSFLLLVCLLLIGAPFVLLGSFPERLRTALETNVAETSPTPRFEELQTRRVLASYEQVYDASIRAIDAQTGWRMLENNREGGELRVEIGVPALLGLFKDELTIRITNMGETQTEVALRSRSLQGRIDLGENRRHILQFYRALNEELPQYQ